MTVLKKLMLLMALGVLVTLGTLVVTADKLPTPPLPDFLGIHWGGTEPLKTHTLQRVEVIDAHLPGNAE